jgi:UDP-N-acetylmuramoyl-L-alanyl-D-glutamate--2,6-diaminopimelate ligase
MTATTTYGGALQLSAIPRPEVPSGPYAVAGLKRAGVAAVEALCRLVPGTDVIGLDRNPASVTRRVRRHLGAAGVRVRLGPAGESLDFVPAPRALIKSPGIGFDSPLIGLAQRRAIPVLDELELGWRLHPAPMLAVTGTNGKTTVASLATAVLAGSERRVCLAGNAEHGAPLSAVAPTADWIVCEVSSFQLEGCTALRPEVAVFTNLTHDHLARHGSMARYGQLKRRLFVRESDVVPLAVIDVAGDFGRRLADEVEALGGRVVRIGFDQPADYEVRTARWDLHGAAFALRTPTGDLTLETRLPGVHNARNVAAAVAIGDLFGVDRGELAETIATQNRPPGRVELIDVGQEHALVLDIAASPDAVEQVLQTLRATISPGGQLAVVLGVLGSPDPPHLRAMGRIARELADRLILTAGSLRRRPPRAALDGLVAGAQTTCGATVEVVPERRGAIQTALRGACCTDIVAVLGRGRMTEPVQDHQLSDLSVLRQLAACERF